MPNSISYEDTEGSLQEWSIPPLHKWISGDALPTYEGEAAEIEITIAYEDEDGLLQGRTRTKVKMTSTARPYDIAEEFVDLGAEFRVFIMNILTKFFQNHLITQLVDTEEMDFDNYHGSWSASWMKNNPWRPSKGGDPHSLLNTSGLYIILPNDPQEVKTTGLRVMYRQAQSMNMKYYEEMKDELGKKFNRYRNEIITIVFPPLSYDPTKKLDGGTGFGSGGKDKHNAVEYDSEPISGPWLAQQLADHHVLMILGVKNETYPCLNWNLHQLNQLLSKITLSSRAS